MAKVRIDKFISSQMNISRTDAKKILRNSVVTLNGENIAKGDIIVDTEVDSVSVNGKNLCFKEFVYIMQNKPSGVVSASNSPKDVTVIDILPESLKRKGLFPAGRLDKDTVGFVLITDNGEFAHNILSPAHHVKKTYIVKVEDELSEAAFRRFREGMKIGDELFKPAELRLLENKSDDGKFLYEIKIVEGRYHQIKRMFASAGSPVIQLKRTAIGGLMLDAGLSDGESKELSSEELEKIFL